MLARDFQILRADEATGRCLSISLDYALAAHARYGVDVRLIKWQVLGDSAYVDHWAVQLHASCVLDLSRIQVDGLNDIVFKVDSYPANYQNMRTYPASLLIGAYVDCGASDAPRLSNKFMWACGTKLCRFDLAAAVHARSARNTWAALRDFGTFLALSIFSQITRALETRASLLSSRLNENSDPPVETVGRPHPGRPPKPAARHTAATGDDDGNQ